MSTCWRDLRGCCTTARTVPCSRLPGARKCTAAPCRCRMSIVSTCTSGTVSSRGEDYTAGRTPHKACRQAQTTRSVIAAVLALHPAQHQSRHRKSSLGSHRAGSEHLYGHSSRLPAGRSDMASRLGYPSRTLGSQRPRNQCRSGTCRTRRFPCLSRRRRSPPTWCRARCLMSTRESLGKRRSPCTYRSRSESP